MALEFLGCVRKALLSADYDDVVLKVLKAIDLWRDIPYSLKDLSTFSFAKEIKHYLLSEQYSKKFE